MCLKAGDTRSSSDKVTVVLNIWNKHVFTYKRDVRDIFFMAKTPRHQERELLSLHKDDDKSQYEDMVPFEWPALMEAVQEKESTHFWATTPLGVEFFEASMKWASHTFHGGKPCRDALPYVSIWKTRTKRAS